MMKRYFISAICLLAAAVSCVEEKKDDPKQPTGEIGIVASLPAVGKVQPVWSEGEHIGVVTDRGASVEFELYDGAGTPEGSLSGDIAGLEAGDSLFVCRPCVEGFTRTALPLELEKQVSIPGRAAPSDITVAKGVFRNAKKPLSLTMEHILGGIEFSLENKRIGAQTVTSLGIISDGIVLSASYDLSSEKLSCRDAVSGRSTMSLAGNSVPSKGKASWVLSLIPQTLPEGSRAFIELNPRDTVFKELSSVIIREGKLVSLAFTLEFEGLNVKSTIAPFVNAGSASEPVTPLWYQADRYGAFAGENNSNAEFVLASGENTSEAMFLGYPDVEEGAAFTAYYPYSENMEADGTLKFDLTSQEMPASGKLAPYDIAFASGSFGMETEVTFNHLLGGILFDIANTSGDYPLVIESYGITSGSISLSGTFDALKGTVTADAASEGESVCAAGRTVQPGGKMNAFLSVIPQEIPAASTIWLKTTSGQTFQLAVESAVAIGPGEYFPAVIEAEGERGGHLKDIGSCTYDTEGSVLWTSPAVSPDGSVVYVTSSNYKIAAVPVSGGALASTPGWVVDPKPSAGMASGGNSNVTSTPAVSSTGIYALLGKGTYASLVKVLPEGTLDYYRWASYYVNGNTTSPDPSSAQFEFDMECPIIFPTNDTYKERVMFSIQQGNGDNKRFATARGCGDPNSTSDTKTGGSRQTSKGTTTNLGGTLGYVGSDGWYFIAGRTGGSSPGGQIIKTNTSGGSMSGSTTASHMLGYVSATGSFANGRGSQMAQDADYVYYIGWNSSADNYPGGNTLLFKYAKSKIKASTAISPEYIVALKGGVSKSSSSGMRGVGSVLSADGSVLYVTTCSTDDGESAYVHAVNTSDGSIKWSHEAVDIYGVAAVDDMGNVYFNDSNKGELVQLDYNTGAEVDAKSIGTVKSSPTIGPGGILYCNTLNADGQPTLRAFSISESNGPARGWSQLGGNPQKSGIAY